jgi:putative nucleotidyltransferase with HDIG domain
MKGPIPERHYHQFVDYVRPFMGRAETKDDPLFYRRNLELKLSHSLRVAAHCRSIAEAERLTENDQEAATITGLYHDIGRFEQFIRHATFLDARSVNHATLGAEILTKGPFLSGLDPDTAAAIIAAVQHHNVQDLPVDLAPRHALLGRIVRDADKLDILDIFCDYLDHRHVDRNEAMELGLPDTPGYTPEVAELVLAGRTIPHAIRRVYNDVKLCYAAWVFDLNFAESLAILNKKGIIDRIFSHLPADTTMRQVQNRIGGHCAE